MPQILKPQDVLPLPAEGFVRLNTVLAHVPVCKTTWFDGVRNGRFPKPTKFGRASLWRAEDIRKLIAEMGG